MRLFQILGFSLVLGSVALPARADVPALPPAPAGACDADPGSLGCTFEKCAAKMDEGAIGKFFCKVDGVFGAYLVTPLYKALFLDLIFWDDTIEGEAAVGAKLDGKVIAAFDPAKGYRTDDVKEAELAKALVIVEEPRDHDLGNGVVASLQGGPGTYELSLKAGIVDAAAYDKARKTPLAEWKGQALSPELGELPDGTVARVVEGLAPFPVVVKETTTPGEGEGDTVVTAELVEMKVSHELKLEVKVGERVYVQQDDLRGAVLAINGDKLSLELSPPTWHKAADATIANPKQLNLPFIVVWLVCGAIFFTLRMSFINIRGVKHAVSVTAGKFDNPDDEGEISHFQALASALSATIGLGNIAGVALAVSAGGPGAVFWMVVAAFFGMSSKFAECTLGQLYRSFDERGRVLGGPMRYLSVGLKEKGLGGLGIVLSTVFAIMCIGGSFGGGNMFQANQAYAAISNAAGYFGLDMSGGVWSFSFGVVLAILVGLVIIGGIQRIGKAAGFIVPFMCGLYVVAAIAVLLMNAGKIPEAFGTIFAEAFSLKAGFGGLIGVIITGFRRAAFSNEAGVGSAAIAHSAAATNEPVREGIVALLEPFIDTIVICTMTGLVVVITGAYQADAGDGVLMTSYAFETVFPWFPVVLSVAVFFFAFSTMISWSYYGDRCFTSLFGERFSIVYKIVFLFFVVFGCVFKLGNVLDFSDLMVLGMAFPNILGVVILSGVVKEKLDDYWGRFTSGQMKTYK